MKTKETSTRKQALAWWNNHYLVIKWDLIVKYKNLIVGYPDRNVDTLTGREIEEIWKNETQESNLTDEEFRELYNDVTNSLGNICKEVSKSNQKQLNITNCGNKNCQDGVINGITPRICKKCNSTNAKQFKQFDESLFKSYISKFSDEDKIRMYKVFSDLLEVNSKYRFLDIIDKAIQLK